MIPKKGNLSSIDYKNEKPVDPAACLEDVELESTDLTPVDIKPYLEDVAPEGNSKPQDSETVDQPENKNIHVQAGGCQSPKATIKKEKVTFSWIVDIVT